MNKTVLTAILMLCAIDSAQAEESGLFRVKAGFGNADYTQEFSDENFTLDGSFGTQSLSIAYAFPSHSFIDLTIRQNASGAEATFSDQLGQKRELTREDMSLTWGSADLVSGTQATIGLFSGKTEIAPYKYAHESTGLTFGVARSFSGDLGSLGIGAGIALLTSTFTDSNGASVDSETSTGYSVNASYSYLFTKNVGVSADIKYQVYDSTYPTSKYWKSFDDTETITSTNLSLIGQF